MTFYTMRIKKLQATEAKRKVKYTANDFQVIVIIQQSNSMQYLKILQENSRAFKIVLHASTEQYNIKL